MDRSIISRRCRDGPDRRVPPRCRIAPLPRPPRPARPRPRPPGLTARPPRCGRRPPRRIAGAPRGCPSGRTRRCPARAGAWA
ncbi:MAG: hypothetical protein F4011_07505 [Acidimicrobiaceae bacterium]|nr:hypothetical protein [Acidimicrobiaceae bacterium]MYL04013.1 hypothetical protein [Acidimicrobiaceae bacterium]